MPFVPPAALPPVAITREYREPVQSHWTPGFSWANDLLERDATRFQFTQFRVAELLYRASQPLRASYEPPISGRDGRFIVEGLHPEIVGRGRSLQQAQRDWELNLDAHVQRLLAKQDFEQSAEDRKLIGKLHQYFDFNELKYANPIRTRAYGRLVGLRGHKYRVRWVDGTKSTLSRHQIPGNMVAYRVGQPFEAVVQRNARTWQLIKVESAFAARPLPKVSKDEADELFSAKASHTPARTLGWD